MRTREINDFLAGKRNSFNVPLDLSAETPFQQAVWRALIGIPFGSSCSYGQIAAVIGRSGAVRAVGTAVGANPISIIVPCLKVLKSNDKSQFKIEKENGEILTLDILDAKNLIGVKAD